MTAPSVHRPRCDLKTALFYGTIAVFIAHEMDAMARSEWQLLYLLRSLPEEVASAAFLYLHIPLIILILWLGHHPNSRVATLSRVSFSLFLILHAILHFLLSDKPSYPFPHPVSDSLIYPAAALGFFYVMLQFRRSNSNRSQ